MVNFNDSSKEKLDNDKYLHNEELKSKKRILSYLQKQNIYASIMILIVLSIISLFIAGVWFLIRLLRISW